MVAGGPITTKISLSTLSTVEKDDAGETKITSDKVANITIPTISFLNFIEESLKNSAQNKAGIIQTDLIDNMNKILERFSTYGVK